jgi:hypothetical protein
LLFPHHLVGKEMTAPSAKSRPFNVTRHAQ